QYFTTTLFPYTTLFRSTDTILPFNCLVTMLMTTVKYSVHLKKILVNWTIAKMQRTVLLDFMAKREIHLLTEYPVQEISNLKRERSEEHTSELQSRSDLV